jgi:hypothetical protein
MNNSKYLIYQIKNLKNQKIYIGCHKTDDLEDGYMGSGTLLKRAISKHGLSSFKKTILHIYDNPDDMFAKEAELVNQKFVSRKDTYNLKIGGYGGFDHINKEKDESYLKVRSDNGKNSVSCGWSAHHTKRKNDPEYRKRHIQNAIEGKRKKSILLHGDPKESFRTFKGKKHKESTKKKIGEKASINQMGKGNSQYGTFWMYNLELELNKKVKNEDLEEHLSEGWIKGRKMRF